MGKEKPKADAYWRAPWEMKKGEFETFIKVTPTNIKQAKTIGRIFYIIEKNGNKYTFCGVMTIDPCYTKGWWRWPHLPFVQRPPAFKNATHFKIYLDSDKSRDEWTEDYKALFQIYDDRLYIRQEDPILTYIKES